MRLRVVSDGTAGGTHVYPEHEGAREDGQLRHVKRIGWEIEAGKLAKLTIVVDRVPIDFEAEDPTIEIPAEESE